MQSTPHLSSHFITCLAGNDLRQNRQNRGNTNREHINYLAAIRHKFTITVRVICSQLKTREGPGMRNSEPRAVPCQAKSRVATPRHAPPGQPIVEARARPATHRIGRVAGLRDACLVYVAFLVFLSTYSGHNLNHPCSNWDHGCRKMSVHPW